MLSEFMYQIGHGLQKFVYFFCIKFKKTYILPLLNYYYIILWIIGEYKVVTFNGLVKQVLKICFVINSVLVK